MSDLFITHLLHAHLDDLRRSGEANTAVRRALRERRADAMALRAARRARAGHNGPRPVAVPTPAVVSTACAGSGRGAAPAATCCTVGA